MFPSHTRMKLLIHDIKLNLMMISEFKKSICSKKDPYFKIVREKIKNVTKNLNIFIKSLYRLKKAHGTGNCQFLKNVEMLVGLLVECSKGQNKIKLKHNDIVDLCQIFSKLVVIKNWGFNFNLMLKTCQVQIKKFFKRFGMKSIQVKINYNKHSPILFIGLQNSGGNRRNRRYMVPETPPKCRHPLRCDSTATVRGNNRLLRRRLFPALSSPQLFHEPKIIGKWFVYSNIFPCESIKEIQCPFEKFVKMKRPEKAYPAMFMVWDL